MRHVYDRAAAMRSLGIIIYPDGSQAEIIAVRYADTNHPTHRIEPLVTSRRLTYAPFGLLMLALLAFGLSGTMSGCVHLQRVGDKPICLLDYDTGIKSCQYDTWKACHDDLRKDTMCYHR